MRMGSHGQALAQCAPSALRLIWFQTPSGDWSLTSIIEQARLRRASNTDMTAHQAASLAEAKPGTRS